MCDIGDGCRKHRGCDGEEDGGPEGPARERSGLTGLHSTFHPKLFASSHTLSLVTLLITFLLSGTTTVVSPLPSPFTPINPLVENSSTHFLTFNLVMEASEHFAFSGPKTTAVQVMPLSRHTVQYNLFAAKRGLWIQPQLVVIDTYFNKNLRVLPTGDMRSDKKGLLVWVDADD